MKQKKDKNTRIVFGKEIDSAINGFAIGAAFLGIGVFLLIKPDYFSAPIASYIVGAVIGLFGTFGIGVELSKTARIKGIDSISLGIVFLLIWLAMYMKIQTLWSNILSFILLMIGCYAVFLGLFQSVYSIIRNIKERIDQKKDNSKQDNGSAGIISQIVLFLTQLCGLGLAIVNIVKAINT